MYNWRRLPVDDVTSAIPTQLHPTRRFYDHLDVLLDALEEEADQFEAALADALEALAAYDWSKEHSESLLRPHGHSGRDFSYPINDEFLLIVRRETDRVEHKPQMVHLFLKTIERVSH